MISKKCLILLLLLTLTYAKPNKQMKKMISQIPDEWKKITINSCDYVLATMFGAKYINFEANTFLDCINDCVYNTDCDGAIYNPNKKECVHSTNLYLGSSYKENKQWKKNNVIAIYRKTKRLRYYQEQCFTGNRRECKRRKVCKWNSGRRGVNQFSFYTTNYCGRVKCSKRKRKHF